MIDDEVMWFAASRTTDWSDLEALRAIVSAAAEQALIGPATWERRSPSAKERALDLEPGEVWTALADRLGGRPDAEHTIGGDRWEVSVSLTPFDAAAGSTEDDLPSLCVVTFEREDVRGTEASDRLYAAFRSAHADGRTDWAAIHVRQDRADIEDEPAYNPPLSDIGRFYGALWANYLGPALAPRFEAAYDDLPVAVERVEGGVFFRADADVTDIAAMRDQLIAVTEQLRAASSG